MLPISSAFKPFGGAWWAGLLNRAVAMVKDQAERGQGADGAFPGYSAKYAKRKSAGAFRRQASTQVAPPNFELTGDTRNDLKVLGTHPNGGEVGWPTRGEVIRGNADRGRAMSSEANPLNARALRLIDKEVRAMLRGQLGRTRGVRVIRIGK